MNLRIVRKKDGKDELQYFNPPKWDRTYDGKRGWEAVPGGWIPVPIIKEEDL